MPYVVVFLNKVDQVDDEESLGLVEVEVRDLLNEYRFPGDDVPVIQGSALKALEGDADHQQKILDLAKALDNYIPQPERRLDQLRYPDAGRGRLLDHRPRHSGHGHIEQSVIHTGDEVEIVGIHPEVSKTVVTGVEMFRKILDEGQAGDNVGCLLRGTKREEIERGQVLCKPGSITPHTKFKAQVYCLKKEEGGRHTPFFDGYRPQFYFRTTDVTGVAHLPEGTEMVMPGDNVEMTVDMIQPIAMDQGLRFARPRGGRTDGSGVVTEIIEVDPPTRSFPGGGRPRPRVSKNVPATLTQNKIRIRLKAYDHSAIETAAKEIVDDHAHGRLVSGPVPLPTEERHPA